MLARHQLLGRPNTHSMLNHLSKPSTLALLLHVSELTQGKARILIHRNWMRAVGELSLRLPEFCWAPQNLKWVENSVFVEESIRKTCLVLHIKYAFRRLYVSFSSWGPKDLGETLPPRGRWQFLQTANTLPLGILLRPKAIILTSYPASFERI